MCSIFLYLFFYLGGYVSGLGFLILLCRIEAALPIGSGHIVIIDPVKSFHWFPLGFVFCFFFCLSCPSLKSSHSNIFNIQFKYAF